MTELHSVVTAPVAAMALQPGTYCNLACSYCYLPSKDSVLHMPITVATAVADYIRAQDHPGRPIELIWHGGEPLTVGTRRFAKLLSTFEDLRAEGRIVHAIQTNATLIDRTWIDVLLKYGVTVGISVDGPKHFNAHRVNRSGKQSYDRTIKGVRTLMSAGIPCAAICVVTPETVRHPDELLRFFDDLGVVSVGFNFVEQEAANTAPCGISEAQSREFWERVIALSPQMDMRVREVARIIRYLKASPGYVAGHRDLFPTVAHNGDVVLLSPEFAGVAGFAQYDSFVVGNILHRPLADILAEATTADYVRDYFEGKELCRRHCEYFGFCGGGHAANKVFENRNARSTYTAHCRHGTIAPYTAFWSAFASWEKEGLEQ